MAKILHHQVLSHISKKPDFTISTTKMEKFNPDKCTFCEYTTNNPAMLTKHMKKQHPLDNKVRFCCFTCSKTFQNEVHQRNHFNSVLHLINASQLEKEIKAIPLEITYEKYEKKANLSEVIEKNIENQKKESQSTENEPSTSTSSPPINTNIMDGTEKPKKPFNKRIQHLDVDRNKKMYKNKRKPIQEKNLRQDPAIIPLESTIQQKDPRLDFNIHWVYLNSTTFEEIDSTPQPVLHIEEKEKTNEDNKLQKDTEEALQMIEEIIPNDSNPSNNTDIYQGTSVLNTPVLDNLENMELETINTEDLVELFPKDNCWLTIDETGKTDELALDQQHCSPTPCNLLDYILDDRCL